MGVVVESSVWEPGASLYVFIIICIFFSLSLSSSSSSSSSNSNNHNDNSFDRSSPSRSLRFRRKFLLLYSLASGMEGMWSVIGEFEAVSFGVSKVGILASLCIGCAASILVGSFLGMLSDSIGHKKGCLLFGVLHMALGVWRRITSHPSLWFASICLSLATSIFSCCFEAWLVVETKEQGFRQDTLNDTFWLMTFMESVMLVASQVLANWLMGIDMKRGMASLSNATIILALMSVIYLSRGWKEPSQMAETKDNRVSYVSSILSDKRMWLLGLAHSCLHFAVTIFWILWAPTLVADGREVHLGLIYPCLMGARMLGSTVFQWLLTGPSSPRTEDCLICAFSILGLVLSVVAYDYQEVGVLVCLFILFHAGVGLILPSLARLRTIHVPNELRGGMMSLSLAPANVAIMFLLIQRGYYQNIENSTLLAFGALALFIAAGCMYLLKRWGKQLYHNGHKL